MKMRAVAARRRLAVHGSARFVLQTSPEEHSMKNVSVTMGLAALLLAGGTKAHDITIDWLVPPKNISGFTGYLPKLASDGQNIDETMSVN